VLFAHYAAAYSALARGELDAARVAANRALELARRGGIRLDTAYGLLLLARIARVEGSVREAHDLLGRARRQVAACADPGFLAERVLGTARGLRATGAGAAADGAGAGDDLSERERAVLALLPSELSLREIGAELFVSLNTVKSHTRNIYLKLGAGGRDEAVARARELGLL
jgi:LuxR family transcriptional regulator, maltose regulon positive regulatory protein